MNVREIAKRANASTATVSRILNGNPVVGQELRERVMRVVEELNYVPSGFPTDHRKGAQLALMTKASVIGTFAYQVNSSV